ncbi:MAG: NAD-dependent epimerase/dehydratase family protein [Acidimicrobiales bacterium]|nr:NAD-dependent epimerase/dehydratase family protein [Acidimicrobiales bacterium]
MRVLITGATGFLGSRIASQLSARGDLVRALVRESSDRSRLEGLDVELAFGDVADKASVEAALDRVDLVIHCAALVEFGPRDPEKLRRVNVEGTQNVLGGAAERSIPAVHVSSLAALGATPSDADPQDETYWNDGPPAAVYEETKREAHLFARGLAAQGAPVRIAIPGGIYGFGDRSTMYDLIRLYTLYPLPVGYLPDVRQSVVNVDDCADAILRIAEDGADGDEYLVVADVVTIAEWLRIICRAAGRRGPFVFLPTAWVRALAIPGAKVAGWFGQPPDMVPETVAVATHDSAYSGAKLRRELGWSPRSLGQGMAEMTRQIKHAERQRRAARQRSRS